VDALDLRPITAGDEAFLFRVYAETRTEELAQVPWSDEQKQAFLWSQFSAQHRHYVENYPGAEMSVVLRNDVPAGRLYLHRRADEIRIMDIALLPEHRRAGLGTRLLRAVLSEAEAAGKPVRLHVERFNPGLALYERLGFVLAEDRGVYLLLERRPLSAS
jgi:ribosomal protein S18 acetylase RimI-like enzyme